MTTPIDGVLADAPPAYSRHQMRLERQGRVGILRNLKEPPRLPPRKASLTGRWLDLRSRRRLRRQGFEEFLPEDVHSATAVVGHSPRQDGRGHGGASADAAPSTVQADVAFVQALRPKPGLPAALRRGVRFLAGVCCGTAFAGLALIVALWVLARFG